MGGCAIARVLRAVRLGVMIVFTLQAAGADFGFSTTIRAGMSSNGDWELGIGPTGNNTANSAHVNGALYYPNNVPTRFELGYTSATNTAFLRYYYSSYPPLNLNLYREVTYSTNAPGLGANSTWTLPGGSFSVSATGIRAASGTTVDQLTLSGVQVLQPFSTTLLAASQPGGNSPHPGQLTSMGNNVVFRTGASGNWLLSGRIAFSGLQAHVGGSGATRSQLQLLLGASGTSAETPEPGTLALAGLGVAGLALVRMSKNNGRGKS